MIGLRNQEASIATNGGTILIRRTGHHPTIRFQTKTTPVEDGNQTATQWSINNRAMEISTQVVERISMLLNKTATGPEESVILHLCFKTENLQMNSAYQFSN